MKLESYAIAQALENRQIDAAVRLLLDHFGLFQPDVLPKHTVIPARDELRLLAWAGDYFYEWSSAYGFERGCHNYPLDPDHHTHRIDSIILWIQGAPGLKPEPPDPDR
jgi:hypothetical protein